ncbi:phosphate ABC transporter ATP-binding protein PstB [Candidatus Mycobacterium methanotrophicum]|uniref:Phosphate ABC transporter ATP-binding protein PstB n=1 Tax=Candidatus Mycobacterium methanotrophicum TaxID=2943498 RepID=A0ABY4QIF1_9MYCO|nr:phosphate ABC transporter ATP-binding protein PstB [Candidatus Mycobacterium methanotrophicum]UQX10812.1 phosphate ABC transporter ATP-binding protein PstB [Candidatus Mycobacterium methanotrophicum]
MDPEQLDAESGAVDPGVADPAIRVVNLTLGFGAKTVLDQVSLDFPARAVTSLLGPTGSGKTTFLRTLNRMNDKVSGYRYSGDVALGGRSIFGGRDLMEFRRRVGMLFQRPNPFPMSIVDNVVAGVRAHKMAPRKEFKSIAEARLTEVGLWDAVKDRLGDSPFRLSGGQQQLLCLARALAVNPEVLLLDEPTSSLDPTTTEKIEELIRSLADRLTVVIVTHDLAQAARIGDRTALFFDGKLVEEGPTEQLFLSPKHAETVRYVSGLFGDRRLLGVVVGATDTNNEKEG